MCLVLLLLDNSFKTNRIMKETRDVEHKNIKKLNKRQRKGRGILT